jgi:hypothetical protein
MDMTFDARRAQGWQRRKIPSMLSPSGPVSRTQGRWCVTSEDNVVHSAAHNAQLDTAGMFSRAICPHRSCCTLRGRTRTLGGPHEVGTMFRPFRCAPRAATGAPVVLREAFGIGVGLIADCQLITVVAMLERNILRNG